ncbi:MAG: hypothetical protein IJL02_09835 [Methanobrevibacter sp.]|uniref:hypothetical protein n=1 Tax=Methanobrevibacter sp. TaxID=66852 RepID=UPI0025F24D83|nr:hypothetical protein [Methanobrevibacter sp.]MBQ6100141.1 hypothetical protein [Methanobrevibacter sp.]
MKFICPTIGEDEERDFLVTGSLEDFKIIVFSSVEEYEKGIEYLKLTDYSPCEVSAELFKKLSENDDEFSGIILDLASKNKFISKKELLEESF